MMFAGDLGKMRLGKIRAVSIEYTVRKYFRSAPVYPRAVTAGTGKMRTRLVKLEKLYPVQGCRRINGKTRAFLWESCTDTCNVIF